MTTDSKIKPISPHNKQKTSKKWGTYKTRKQAVKAHARGKLVGGLDFEMNKK